MKNKSIANKIITILIIVTLMLSSIGYYLIANKEENKPVMIIINNTIPKIVYSSSGGGGGGGSSTPTTTYSWCYQETANASSVSDGTCSLSYTGNYSYTGTWTDPTDTFDGSIITFGKTTALGTDSLFINYTKPTNVQNTSLWVVSDGNLTSAPYFDSLVIPSDCWSYNETILSLAVESVNITHTLTANWTCFDNVTWRELRFVNNTLAGKIYDEGMNWYVQN